MSKTQIIEPAFLSTTEWRDVAKNNGLVVLFTFTTTERFLPRVLVEAGFFDSTSQVKRNKPELWILIPDDTLIWTSDLAKWADITIHFLDSEDNND